MAHSLSKIVSGGQTGVDRAALDVAIFLDIEHGGWCPLGRRAEDGRIPDRFKLQEMPQRDYSVRTEQNVVDSDGTLILYRQRMSGGTELTFRLTQKHQRPCLPIDLSQLQPAESSDALADGAVRHDPVTVEQWRERFARWQESNGIHVLNVAGPRESTSPGIARQTEHFLVALMQ